VLMAADILIFKATHVPVGRDQIQHLEMTRDIAQRFNHHYGELLVLPEVVVPEEGSTLSGLDGRKMSKSYNNTIPLFETEKKLRKSVMRIVTNSLEPGEPKDTTDNSLFAIWRAFSSPEETAEAAQWFADGIGWGDMKQKLFEKLNGVLAEPRDRYNELMANPDTVEAILQAGAARARAESGPYVEKLRHAVGLVRS